MAKVLPFDTYETFHKNLTRGLEFNIFPLETADQAEIKLQLPPLSEIRAGVVELHSGDGVTYGRQYKLIGVEKEADGKSYAVVALADTGEVVEREPWDDFKRRVRFGRCRSGTAYDTMARGVQPAALLRHHRANLQAGRGEAWRQGSEAEAGGEEARHEKSGEEGRRKKEPEKKDPLLKMIAAGMEWLRKNPRYVTSPLPSSCSS